MSTEIEKLIASSRPDKGTSLDVDAAIARGTRRRRARRAAGVTVPTLAIAVFASVALGFRPPQMAPDIAGPPTPPSHDGPAAPGPASHDSDSLAEAREEELTAELADIEVERNELLAEPGTRNDARIGQLHIDQITAEAELLYLQALSGQNVPAAVLPVDAVTAEANFAVLGAVGAPIDEEIHDCIEKRGIDPGVDSSPDPTFDRVGTTSRFEFPDLDRIAFEGLLVYRSEGPAPGSEPLATPEVEEAWRVCSAAPASQQLRELDDDITELMDEWFVQLRAINDEPAVRQLRDEFGQCVMSTTDMAPEQAQFDHFLDEAGWRQQEAEEAGNPDRAAEIASELGLVYAECGEDLFDAVVGRRLEIRNEFVATYADELQSIRDRLRNVRPLGFESTP